MQHAPHTKQQNKPQSEPDVVTVEGVSKVYPRSEAQVIALNDVSLRVHTGETLAITGPSGSGKSTLLSLIAGLDHPSAGQIHVLGHNLTTMNEDQRATLRRTAMGFVFQNYNLLPTLTVWENVMLPLIPQQGHSLELKHLALQCIERVGLEQRIHHLPTELSGGEQQRVGLARALVTNPKIILADEPTGNLDRASAEAILELLFGALGNSGRTILVSTHDPVVAACCNRCIHLHSGKINLGEHP